MAGAAFNVADPNAGTLSGGGDVCLSGDAAILTATPNGDSNTPAGYSLAYVLTSGAELTIQQLGEHRSSPSRAVACTRSTPSCSPATWT
ncbi:MAG: hypothetical protein IPG92_02385 [Flavobacteriales bacterium]|nr:hypothetical protein [Flavobacteriales bacterium]